MFCTTVPNGDVHRKKEREKKREREREMEGADPSIFPFPFSLFSISAFFFLSFNGSSHTHTHTPQPFKKNTMRKRRKKDLKGVLLSFRFFHTQPHSVTFALQSSPFHTQSLTKRQKESQHKKSRKTAKRKQPDCALFFHKSASTHPQHTTHMSFLLSNKRYRHTENQS